MYCILTNIGDFGVYFTFLTALTLFLEPLILRLTLCCKRLIRLFMHLYTWEFLNTLPLLATANSLITISTPTMGRFSTTDGFSISYLIAINHLSAWREITQLWTAATVSDSANFTQPIEGNLTRLLSFLINGFALVPASK